MKLTRTIGFEMTGLAPNYKEETNMFGDSEPTERTDNVTQALSILIANNLVERYSEYRVIPHIDVHCI